MVVGSIKTLSDANTEVQKINVRVRPKYTILQQFVLSKCFQETKLIILPADSKPANRERDLYEILLAHFSLLLLSGKFGPIDPIGRSAPDILSFAINYGIGGPEWFRC